MTRAALVALAALAIAAPAAAAHADAPRGAHNPARPTAQIFATNNTRVITDPDDRQLHDPLTEFARQVERIVEQGGGRPSGSQILDGVFFDDRQGTTTFERSREFAVDRVADDELHTIADTIRARFHQQSVLTFDPLRRRDGRVNSIELEVPDVTPQALRDGLLADQTARERLFGGSVTQDHHLLLVADLADSDLARTFASRIGGDLQNAATRYGRDEFVDGPSPVRVDHRTLLVSGSPDSDAVTLRETRRRLALDLGSDGSVDFKLDRRRFDRVRVDLSGGVDTLTVEGSRLADHFDVSATGRTAQLRRSGGGAEPIELSDVDKLHVDALGGADSINVGDLATTDVFQVDADLGPGDRNVDQATVNGSNEQDQISVSGSSDTVSVLGPTFVRLEHPESKDRLTVNGRGGDDIISSSTAGMALTLNGGDDNDVLIGGPGDDALVGGNGSDDVKGGKGDDSARIGADFDRFSWAPGDGNGLLADLGG
jgi:Ca2+-binding RTX toxin-like protein